MKYTECPECGAHIEENHWTPAKSTDGDVEYAICPCRAVLIEKSDAP